MLCPYLELGCLNCVVEAFSAVGGASSKGDGCGGVAEGGDQLRYEGHVRCGLCLEVRDVVVVVSTVNWMGLTTVVIVSPGVIPWSP